MDQRRNRGEGGERGAHAARLVVDPVSFGTFTASFEKNDVILTVFCSACLALEAVVAFFVALRHPGNPQCCKKFLLPSALTQMLLPQISQACHSLEL